MYKIIFTYKQKWSQKFDKFWMFDHNFFQSILSKIIKNLFLIAHKFLKPYHIKALFCNTLSIAYFLPTLFK